MKLQSKPTYYLSILSLSIILFMLGMSLVFSIHSSSLIEILKKQQNFVLDLAENISDADHYVIRQFLEANKMVDKSSIVYVSKKQGLKLMKEELGDTSLFLDIENPLHDIFEFNMASGEFTQEAVVQLKAELELIPGVLGFHFQEDPFESLKQLSRRINRLLLFLIALLLLFSLALIYNTIRLMLASQEKRIFTMQMVGARDDFIVRPYIRTGASIGWWAGLLSIFFLVLSLISLWTYFSIPGEIIKWVPTGFILGLLFVLGLGFSSLCSYIIVNRYLRTLDTTSINT